MKWFKRQTLQERRAKWQLKMDMDKAETVERAEKQLAYAELKLIAAQAHVEWLTKELAHLRKKGK